MQASLKSLTFRTASYIFSLAQLTKMKEIFLVVTSLLLLQLGLTAFPVAVTRMPLSISRDDVSAVCPKTDAARQTCRAKSIKH